MLLTVIDTYEKKKTPRKDIYYLDWLNKCTKDKLDANAKKDKLVNDSGLNEKIKTLATKEDKNISNRNNIKSRTRQKLWNFKCLI